MVDGSTLINKSGIWKSEDQWNLINEGTMIYIKNTSDNNKVLGVKDGKVIPEVKDPNNASQLWIKGEENS